MIKNISLLLVVLVLGIGYTIMNDGSAPRAVRPVIPPQDTEHDLMLAPDFTWLDLNGNKHTLYDIQDKVIVLNIWATWCTPCVKEFPQMVELAKDKKDKSIFIFLSVDENKEDIIRFLKKYGDEEKANNVFIGWDKTKDISMDLFGTQKYPETFIVSPKHYITDKIVGADVDWTSDAMRKKIDEIYNQ